MHIIQTDSVSLERVILKKCHSKNCLAKWFHGNLPNIGEGVRATNAPVHYRVLLLFLIFVFNLHMYSITICFFCCFFWGGANFYSKDWKFSNKRVSCSSRGGKATGYKSRGMES